MSQRRKVKPALIIGVLAGLFLIGLTVSWWRLSGPYRYLFDAQTLPAANLSVVASSTPPVPVVQHLPTPAAVRALYLTQCAASADSFRSHLLGLADETEINAIVVDLKDYSGTVAFDSTTALPGGKGCRVGDFAELVKLLHERQIYVIGRLTVFQDPLYTKTYPKEAVQSAATGAPWRDRKGLSFVDVNSKPFWDYIVALSREAYELGVDEINFDYIRYPSDGNMADTRYQGGGSKAENLETFFAYLAAAHHRTDFSAQPHNQPPVLSADLFGMTASNYDDLNIGQVLERALPYFDYIDPMVYPSHYPPNFNGWTNPNDHPYDIVFYSLSRAVARTVATTTTIAGLAYERLDPTSTSTPALYRKPAYPATKIRPWLQDFDYPVTYTSAMVKTQIQATYDAGLNSWLMWDPANKYTRSAYEAASTTMARQTEE